MIISSVTDFVDGRATSVKLLCNDKKIQIINVYAPNNSAERKRFNTKIAAISDDDYIHILGAILTARKIFKWTEIQSKPIRTKDSKNWMTCKTI